MKRTYHGQWRTLELVLWTDLYPSITVLCPLFQWCVRSYLVSVLAWIQWEIINFFLRMLTWYKSISFCFYFVKTEQAIPKENHMRPEGWLCYSIKVLLQSVHDWQCRHITYRESQSEGKNQRKETQGDSVKAYHKSCYHHWELLMCSNCHGWLYFETFVCYKNKWNGFPFQVLPKMWESDLLFFFFSESVIQIMVNHSS